MGTGCGQDSRTAAQRRCEQSHTFVQRTLLPTLGAEDEYLCCVRVGRESADWRALVMRHLLVVPLAKAQSYRPIDNPTEYPDPGETKSNHLLDVLRQYPAVGVHLSTMYPPVTMRRLHRAQRLILVLGRYLTSWNSLPQASRSVGRMYRYTVVRDPSHSDLVPLSMS
jgi:hypothetical protein